MMKSTSVCTALLAAVGIAACFPDELSSVDELDTVTTVFKQDADFGALQRFTVADSVLHLPDEGNISRSTDQAILSSVRENLNAAGYTEETDPAANPPDVVVLVAISTADNVAYTTYDFWGYWGWYPYWDPLYSAGWGWGYPTGTVAYSYQTGTVLVTLVREHPTDAQSQQVPVLWAAAVNGVLEGASDVQRALNGIDKAFAQSPYLRAQ